MKKTTILYLLVFFTSQIFAQNLIDLETDTLFLGDIQTGTENYRNYFTFTNVYSESIQIANVTTSSGQIVPTYPGDPIDAGVTDTITFQINTNNEGFKVRSIWVKSGINVGILDRDTIVIIFNVTDNPTTTEDFQDKKIDIDIFPNPFLETINIRTENLGKMNQTEIEIINLNGILVYSSPPKSREQSFEINLLDYPSGIYMIRLEIGEIIYSVKIIKE